MGIRATQIKGRTSFLHVFFTRGSWISTNATWTAWKSPSFIDKLWIYSLSWKPESMEKKNSLKPTNNEFIYRKLGAFLRQALKIWRQNAKPPPFLGPVSSSEGVGSHHRVTGFVLPPPVPPTRIPLSSISRQFEMQNSPFQTKGVHFFGLPPGGPLASVWVEI